MAAVEEPVQTNGAAAPEDAVQARDWGTEETSESIHESPFLFAPQAANGEVQARDWGTAEEQAARGRAPVKKEFLMPPGGRKTLAAAGGNGEARGKEEEGGDEGEQGKAGEKGGGGWGKGGKGKGGGGKAEQRLSHRAMKKKRKQVPEAGNWRVFPSFTHPPLPLPASASTLPTPPSHLRPPHTSSSPSLIPLHFPAPIPPSRQAMSSQPCNTVARTGDPSSCPFGATCRFSHDLEIIRAQLPLTLDGTCPFAALRRPCPFGLACRFRDEKHGKLLGSSDGGGEGGEVGGGKEEGKDGGKGKGKGEEEGEAEGENKEKEAGEKESEKSEKGSEKGSEEGSEVRYPGEVNMLEKGLQSKLWKRQLDFPRAVDSLQRIGWTPHTRWKQNSLPLPSFPSWQRKVKPKGEASLMPDLDENEEEGDQGEEGDEGNRPSPTHFLLLSPIRSPSLLAFLSWQRKVKPKGEASLMPDLDENEEEGVQGDDGDDDGDEGDEGGMAEIDREGRRKGVLAAAATAAKETVEAAATAVKETAVVAAETVEKAAVAAAEAIGAIVKEEGKGKEGRVGDDKEVRLPHREKKPVDFKGKLIVAPLTTVGNLPFRRVCCSFGADVTIGEMAMCGNLLQGQASEWALLRRHESEKCFGVQLCGPHPDMVAKAAELVAEHCQVDFVDLNIGCPIDIVVNKGSGSSLLCKPQRLEQVIRATALAIDVPLTVKMRTGYAEGHNVAHRYIPHLLDWGASAVTLHGRTRQQRYSRLADWEYIGECASVKPAGLQFIGNGDVMAYTDWNEHTANGSATAVDSCMLARGALVKPWLLTEITEQRHWDISAGERLDMLRSFTRYGLLHWGSDTRGVETTRRFLLEWLSYLHRYVPVGLLELLPQRINWRPPGFYGRNDLETLFGSDQSQDW
ncbi:unnamed protein product, partial [Closterium sp. NIES-53]